MNQSNLKEILNALELYSNKIMNEMDTRFGQVDKRFEEVDKRFEQVDKRFEQMDQRFEQMDKRFDRLETKFGGLRTELSETQETVDFLSSKYVQHEKKLREIHDL